MLLLLLVEVWWGKVVFENLLDPARPAHDDQNLNLSDKVTLGENGHVDLSEQNALSSKQEVKEKLSEGALAALEELEALEAEAAADVDADVDADGLSPTPSNDDLITDPDREAADLLIIEEVIASLKDKVLNIAEHRIARFAVTKVSLSTYLSDSVLTGNPAAYSTRETSVPLSGDPRKS